MAVYTVHEPPPGRYDAASAPEHFAFVRDGFSLWAFVFGPLWMLWHRMWLVLVGYLIFMAALDTVLLAVGVSSGVSFVVGLLLALLVGFEAPTLRRFALARRKWTNVGLIVSDDLEAAERRFFASWTRAEPRPAAPGPLPAGSPSSLASAAAPGIVGLFPDPGGRR